MKSFNELRKITEAKQETLTEAEDWVLGFDFELEYTSGEGRDIQKHLEKKFRKNYSGSGSGGSGFDVSFDGTERELKKIKKYVEKEFGPVINKKYTNFYQYEGYEVTDELVALEEMSAKDHYRKVMRGGRGKGFVVSSPIDRERYPNREREGLEGPYKSRKSGKIFYYDRKEGKYYDPDSDMYLDVSDVMESTPAYRKMMKDYEGSDMKKVFDILKPKGFRVGEQDDTLVRNMLKKHKNNVKKAAAEIEKKYSNRFESVELEEKIDYKYTGKVVKIKRREFAKVHKDFKNDEEGKERMMVLDPKTGGTISVPVMFEETQLDEKNEPTNPALWKKAIAKAKAKFDVYPSAYANAWASKWYKEQGGGWKKVEESLEEAMSSDKLLGIFNKLKNKDTVEIKFDSGIRKGKDYQKFVVTSGKRTVGKARVERIILKSVDNLRGVAYTLYNRKGNVTLAQGDMGVSIVDIKESVNESVWRTPEERHQTFHEIALGLIANIYGEDANMWRKVVKDERWVDSFGDYVKAKINRGLDVDKPGTAGYMDQQGRGDWSFVIDTLTGVVKYTHNRKSGKFKDTVDFGKYIRSVRESVELDETVRTAFKGADKNTKEFQHKIKSFGFAKSYNKTMSNFKKHAESGDGVFFIEEIPSDEEKKRTKIGNSMKLEVLPVEGNYYNLKKLGDSDEQKRGGTVYKVQLIAMKEDIDNPEYDEELGKMNIGEGKAWDAITKVKDKNQNQKVHGMIVDAMTANLLHKVHDALNSTNQKKFVAAIDKNAAGLKKMVDFAYKQVK